MSIDPVPLSAIEFSDNEIVPIKELTELYESVDWTSYSNDPDGLAKAVDHSDYVITARDAEGVLIGITRCLTDDVHICLIQDVIVRPDHQRTGVGSVMIGRCLRIYEHVRHITLTTDDESDTEAFYESLGFSRSTGHGLASYIKIAD